MSESRTDQNAPDAGAGHIPVLLDEVLDLLGVEPGGRYIDATFGGGGHSWAILERSAPGGEVLAIDADPAAVERAIALASEFPDRFQMHRANFERVAEIARDRAFVPVNGILFDLGLSSFQFDQRERGFSLYSDERLDMRLDPESEGPTAWDIVNAWPEEEIASLIYRFGDESRSRRIARAIARARSERTIETNSELAELVQRALGGRRGSRIHPATRTFQAIRIAVNRELEALEQGLAGSLDLLAVGGRLAVISFHSLEDRIVKRFFQLESRDCICPPGLPVCQCSHRARVRIVTPRPVVPSETEQRENPRSRSAKLRVAERLP